MNSKKYQRIFLIITLAIVSTIGVQLYWNYVNYKENKQRVSNEILMSLNDAVEDYYANLSKNNFFRVVSKSNEGASIIFKDDAVLNKRLKHKGVNISSLKVETDDLEEYKKIPSLIDSIFAVDSTSKGVAWSGNLDAKFPKRNVKLSKSFGGFRSSDSLNVLKGLETVIIAFRNDTLNFLRLNMAFNKALNLKNISADYYFDYYENDSLLRSSKTSDQMNFNNKIKAKSTYLRANQSLVLNHDSTSFDALKKSFNGILISLFLSIVIILSLFYLLSIIKDQKELASVKNDLISNITHEFKTPIATVSTAIEAISNFNVIDDKEKTQRYLSLSSVQLNKLHQMVEKLLETATLDSEKLLLKKETLDVTDLIQRITDKYRLLALEKTLRFSFNIQPIFMKVDAFHFENVISNLIDNAIKYGGDQIEININSILDSTEISIADNGQGIEKHQQDKIFDKFYRVPKGNTHDVKGFGIGLYYCKKIIEKHDGMLNLRSTNNQTVFKISLPNE